MKIAELEGKDLPLCDSAREGLKETISGLRQSADELEQAIEKNDSLLAFGILSGAYSGIDNACFNMSVELKEAIKQSIPDLLNKLTASAEAKSVPTSETGGGE